MRRSRHDQVAREKDEWAIYVEYGIWGASESYAFMVFGTSNKRQNLDRDELGKERELEGREKARKHEERMAELKAIQIIWVLVFIFNVAIFDNEKDDVAEYLDCYEKFADSKG